MRLPMVRPMVRRARFSRLLAPVLSVALLDIPGTVVAAGSASAAEAHPTRTTIAGKKVHPNYRSILRIRGQVIADPGTADAGSIPSAPVRRDRRWNGARTWKRVGSTTTTTTNANGIYTFSPRALANADYRAYYPGQTFGTERTRAITGLGTRSGELT